MPEINHRYALDHFHEQISFVLNSYTPHNIPRADLRNIVIGGLGGSGIGGRIAKNAFYTASPLPIEVVSEYLLPSYCNAATLVVLSSYSGNTEETLAMFDHAVSLGCKIICITSGGELQSKCQANGFPCYYAETGYQPRMALGYSLTTLLLILSEIAGIDLRTGLQSSVVSLQNNDAMKEMANGALEYFLPTISNKFVIITDVPFEAAAVRFCQQIQENAKGEAFISVLPEANHNMIESYYSKQDTNFILLCSGLNNRVSLRFDFIQNILKNINATQWKFPIRESFSLNILLEVIHTLDWLSIMISEGKGADNMSVPNIAKLKDFLTNN